jgi:phospholipid/cholesterol/gamma-HCH transport system ATP-binding protein
MTDEHGPDEPRAEGGAPDEPPPAAAPEDLPHVGPPLPAAAPGAAAGAETGRVSVVREAAPTQDDEYRWHTGLNRPTGAPDAVEFIEVHKAFGRNQILRGLNMGLPEGMISMILGPSGTGKSVCIAKVQPRRLYFDTERFKVRQEFD